MRNNTQSILRLTRLSQNEFSVSRMLSSSNVGRSEVSSLRLDDPSGIEQIHGSTDISSYRQWANANAPSSLKTWMTTEQAARYLGVPLGSLRNMTSNGQIRYYKLGRRNRYKLSDLHELLLSGKRGN
jgi:excisionase family DNA binding protein